MFVALFYKSPFARRMVAPNHRLDDHGGAWAMHVSQGKLL